MKLFKRKQKSQLKVDKWSGSEHYKTGGVEPFDLYRAGDMMRDFCVANIIKYGFRNRRELGRPVDQKDIKKIKHYADELLKCNDRRANES